MKTNRTKPFSSTRTALLLIVTLFISGCLDNSYWTWVHPAGLGPKAQQQAQAECRQLANNEVNRLDFYRPYYYLYPYSYNHFDSRFDYRHRYFYPSYSAPYYNYFDFHLYNRELDRLTRICMQAKGWRLTRVTPPPEK